MLKSLIACAGLFALQAGAAYAGPTTSAPYMTGTFSVTVSEGRMNGNGFNTLPGSAFSGSNVATASFSYTGALHFDNTAAQNSGASGDLNSTFGFSTSNISNYQGSGDVKLGNTQIANFATLSTFLASSGSASGYQYGSLYTIDLGQLSAGTILTIKHDDGISIFQGSTRIDPTIDGPTSAVTDQVKFAASGDTVLYYSRQNGTPSILAVDVPEPKSLVLLGGAVAGLGLIRYRRLGGRSSQFRG